VIHNLQWQKKESIIKLKQKKKKTEKVAFLVESVGNCEALTARIVSSDGDCADGHQSS
jgi:hypothetical protein